MGYNDQKRYVLAAIKQGSIQHATRGTAHSNGTLDVKNLLATGAVSAELVADIIKASSGRDYRCQPHDQIKGIDVHIITKQHAGLNWYIKWYVIEPDVYFISVHN